MIEPVIPNIIMIKPTASAIHVPSPHPSQPAL